MQKMFIVAATALTLFAGPAVAQDMKPVKTLDDFFSTIVGKKLDFGFGHQIFHADGSSTGIWKQYEMVGTWFWDKDGAFCQSMGVKGRSKRTNDCGRTVVVKGDKATITRGDGSKFAVTIMKK